MDQVLVEQLKAQALRIGDSSIEQLVADNALESSIYSLNDLSIDFSKNKLDSKTLALLVQLADKAKLKSSVEAMFAGEPINNTENRPVLHALMRAEQSKLACWPDIEREKQKAIEFADKIRSGRLKGATGKPLSTIVNIGIGGSDLGPKLIIEAFKSQIPDPIETHFLSDVDSQELTHLLGSIDLESTLFILCSKSFTTWETQTNAKRVIAALRQLVGDDWPQHFAGVAVNQQAMSDFGILPERQFLIWDFIGGRYSVWSSIGLICRIALGNEYFERFLAGARAMDQHFQSASLEENLPVVLALVQIWNINFLQHDVFITLPYCHALKLFPDYQQQLEMESNGKSVDKQGKPLPYSTCPYLFGQLGLNAQHAFMQLVHQSERNTYLEFIAVPEKSVPFEDDVAFRSCLAQSSALMKGTGNQVPPEKRCPGDRPSTTLILNEMSPENLGTLIALYEHKVFVQSVIWGINAFDQFGVELGKQIATTLTKGSLQDSQVDNSTKELLRRFAN